MILLVIVRDEDSEEYTVGDFVEDDILAELAAESQGDVSTLGASSSVVYKGPKGSLHRTQKKKRTSRPVDWEYEFTKVVCKGDAELTTMEQRWDKERLRAWHYRSHVRCAQVRVVPYDVWRGEAYLGKRWLVRKDRVELYRTCNLCLTVC